MKKMIALTLLILTVAAVFFPLKAAAFDSQTENEIASAAGAEDAGSLFDDEERSGDKKINIFQKTFSLVTESLRSYRDTFLKSLLTLLSAVLLASLFTSYRRAQGALGQAFSYSSVLVTAGLCFSFLRPVFAFAQESLLSLCTYVTSLLPVTASLYSLGGSVSAGVAGSSALLAFLSAAENFTGSFLLPLLECGFILSLASAMPGGADLRSVTNFAKNLLTTLLAFVFSIFGVVMYFQTVISAASDSYAFRAVRFASGTLIPVIGSMLGDAARTVVAAAGVVKAAVGAMGVVTVFSLVLPPVIYIIMYKTVVLVCGMIARALGCENESKLLYDINGLLSVLMSIMIGTGVIFIIAVALFIRIGVSA